MGAVAPGPRVSNRVVLRCVNPEHLSAGRGIRRPGDEVERFWAKVERRGDDECWPWRGQLAIQRYADGRPRPERQARFAVSTGLRGVEGGRPALR